MDQEDHACASSSDCFVAAAAVTLRAEIIEQIIVKVNGDIFTKTDFEQRQVQALRARNMQPQGAHRTS